MRKAIPALALLAASLTIGATPAEAAPHANPNYGTKLVCDRAGTCRELPVKFNCNSKKNRDLFVWARFCDRG